MKAIFALAAFLVFAPIVRAQVCEEMAPPAPTGVPDTEYYPPDTSNGINNFDSDWSGGFSVDVNAPSGDSGGGAVGVSQEPDVVEGTNDGPYVPSTFLSYQDALAEGQEELSEMGNVVKAEAAHARERATEPGSSEPSESAPTPPAANASSSAAKMQPIIVARETVAEAARENREKQASAENPK